MQYFPPNWQPLVRVLGGGGGGHPGTTSLALQLQIGSSLLQEQAHKLPQLLALLCAEVPCTPVVVQGRWCGSLPLLCVAEAKVQRAMVMLLLACLGSSLGRGAVVRNALNLLVDTCAPLSDESVGPLWQALRTHVSVGGGGPATAACVWGTEAEAEEEEDEEEGDFKSSGVFGGAWDRQMYFLAAMPHGVKSTWKKKHPEMRGKKRKQAPLDLGASASESSAVATAAAATADAQGMSRPQAMAPSRQKRAKMGGEAIMADEGDDDGDTGLIALASQMEGEGEFDGSQAFPSSQVPDKLTASDKEQLTQLAHFFTTVIPQKHTHRATKANEEIYKSLDFLRNLRNKAFAEACELLQCHLWPEDTFLLLCECLIDDGISVHKSKCFVASSLCQCIAGLTRPASRMLLDQVLSIGKVHAKHLAESLILPLLKQRSAGSSQYELVGRVSKVCLDAPQRFALLRALAVQHAELAWSDGTMKLICGLLPIVSDAKTKDVVETAFAKEIAPAMLLAMQFVARLPPSQFNSAKKAVTDSIVYSRWVQALAIKHARACAGVKSSLLEIAASVTSMIKTSVLKAVNKI